MRVRAGPLSPLEAAAGTSVAVGVTCLERVLPGVRAWVLVSALLLPGREPWARPLLGFPCGKEERLDLVP